MFFNTTSVFVLPHYTSCIISKSHAAFFIFCTDTDWTTFTGIGTLAFTLALCSSMSMQLRPQQITVGGLGSAVVVKAESGCVTVCARLYEYRGIKHETVRRSMCCGDMAIMRCVVPCAVGGYVRSKINKHRQGAGMVPCGVASCSWPCIGQRK